MTPDAQRHERERETGTDRDGQREGERDRQTETDRQTDRQRRTQEERERVKEKRRGTRREGDGAANWSQTQFSAARAAQASHQKTRPTIIPAQNLNPNPQARRCQGTSRHRRVIFLGEEAGGLPLTTTLPAIVGLCFTPSAGACCIMNRYLLSHHLVLFLLPPTTPHIRVRSRCSETPPRV